ncbi:MAG: translation initiation factor IF-2 [Candidatus Njordarchaeia archaeon]
MAQNGNLRSPIVVVLGHVDHGKTTLLDKVRGTFVQQHEVGGMTQHIGASFFPIKAIYNVIKQLEDAGLFRIDMKKLKIPGLLFIDTPGHEAFTNLRKRGSSVADIALLVVDVRSGFQPQTYESIELLKNTKTPFIVVANKIDRIPGWRSYPGETFLTSFQKQLPSVQRELDIAIDNIIIALNQIGFESDRYDRVKDFRKTIAIVPTSAVTGEGISDLFFVLVGLTQRFMGDRLKLTLGDARGSVLEVRRMIGVGTTIDVILYDGILSTGDYIVLGGRKGIIVSKIRALLIPKPLDEIRDPRDKFENTEKIIAAAGVRVVAPGLEDALAGSPVYGISVRGKSDDEVQIEIKEKEKQVLDELESLIFRTDKNGVILKADTLGSIEAILRKLQDLGIPIAIADVGSVTKEDAIHASIVKEHAPKYALIIAFNVDISSEAQEIIQKEKIKVIRSNLIFEVFEALEDYLMEYEAERRQKLLESITYPGKIQILTGYIFRKSKPAIVGVRVLAGKIRPGVRLMREDGAIIGTIKQIQSEGKSVDEAIAGMDVAVSIDKGVVGRNIREEMILYVDIPERDARLINRKLINLLDSNAKDIFREFLKIKRKVKGFAWGY